MRTKPRGTDGSLLPSLPWTLGALGFSILPHVAFLPIWITAAAVGCALWRFVIEKRRRALPSGWLRALLALVCFLGVLGTYATISGVGPGSALLVIMAALKLLETRRRRDQFVLLFICIFLVMSSLLREQYIWSLPYLLIALILIMTAWLRMSALPAEPPRESLSAGTRLIAYATPLAIAMWVFFPRLATPFWAVPIDTSRATSGLSETMSPGDISSLSLSDEVAFRVSFDAAVPEPRDRYWRGLVLTRFNGRTWTSNDPFMGPRAYEQVVPIGAPVTYEITLEPTQQIWVFALDMPWTWTLPRTFMGPQQQLARSQPIDQRVAYRAESYPQYRTDVELREYARDWYASLPDGSNPRTVALARNMRSASASTSAFIEAVLRKFNAEEYFYTLEPPALGSDPVDRFMFETRRGFCEHFASAFTVLMRAAGIPARIVLGYQGGELNPLGGHLIVRQSDAHAWTEVWLPERGWIRVDPTAAVAPERIDSGVRGAMFDGVAAAWGLSAPSKWLHQMTLTWDLVNAKWNDWILGYGPDKQQSFMERLGMDDPSWRKMMLTLIASVAVLTAMISALLLMRYRAPAKDRATVLYRRFVKKCGVPPALGETPLAFAERAGRDSGLSPAVIDRITHLYLDARYGSGDVSALARLRAELRALRPAGGPGAARVTPHRDG